MFIDYKENIQVQDKLGTNFFIAIFICYEVTFTSLLFSIFIYIVILLVFDGLRALDDTCDVWLIVVITF